MWHILLLLASVSAQIIPKTSTSQYPYGSCGLRTRNQLASPISPYQSAHWSSEGDYFTLNLTKPGCSDRGLGCGSAPCMEFCREALSRVDAFHVPINHACLVPTIAVTDKDCTALIAKNFAGAARYRTSGSLAWTPTSLDLNSCSGTVTQARINMKGVAFQAPDRWIQLAVPKNMFRCQSWKDICRSANRHSSVRFCAVVPYLNSGRGAHEFCPVIPAMIA